MSKFVGDIIQLEELNCKVCQEPFGNNFLAPRVLNCGHTFCTGCLKVVIRESPYCPDCRLSIGSKDVNSFPVVYIIKQIVESLTDLKRKSIESGIAYLSEDCNFYEVHSSVNLTRESTLFLPSVGSCPLHRAPQQFWCISCCLWICGSCAYLDHSTSNKSNLNACQIVSASRHFKNLKLKQIDRITNQILELKNAFISIENFSKLVTEEIETLKKGQCNNNFDEKLLSKYEEVCSCLINKKIELEALLDIVEDSKEKFNVRTLKQFHKASKYLDSLWTCKYFPRSEDELIEGIFSQILNKIPFVLIAKANSISVSLKREKKRYYSTIKFESHEMILPALKELKENNNIGCHVFPFQEVRDHSKQLKAFMRLSRQGTKLGIIEIELFQNHRSEQFAMLCTGEKGPSYKWTKFFDSGGLFTRYLAGGDYEKNNGQGGAKIIDEDREPSLVRMEDGIICGEDTYKASVLAQFKIFYKVGSSPFARCPIGKVVKGLPLITEIANSDYDRVYIEECGIIVPIEGE